MMQQYLLSVCNICTTRVAALINVTHSATELIWIYIQKWIILNWNTMTATEDTIFGCWHWYWHWMLTSTSVLTHILTILNLRQYYHFRPLERQLGENQAGRSKEVRSWWNCCWGYFSGVDTGAYIDADIHVDSHTDRKEPAETVIIAEEFADAWRLDALSLKNVLKNFNFWKNVKYLRNLRNNES
jgi:hypothetical protein